MVQLINIALSQSIIVQLLQAFERAWFNEHNIIDISGSGQSDQWKGRTYFIWLVQMNDSQVDRPAVIPISGGKICKHEALFLFVERVLGRNLLLLQQRDAEIEVNTVENGDVGTE